MKFMKIFTRIIALCCVVLVLTNCGGPDFKKPTSTENSILKKVKDSTSNLSNKKANNTSDAAGDESTGIVSGQKVIEEFSTFVPPAAVQSNKLPVILFFDPHASGMVPVEMYKSLAGEFGFILAGSNRSHNGQTLDEAFTIFEKMKNHVLQSFPVDASRVYVAGFSGGSRVAAAVGGKYPDIKSVIACGAGIGQIQNQPAPTFDYFGIIGNEDFNLNEMINTDRMLKRAGFNNAMVIFDGGHAWPPVEVMREAFWWIDLNAMKNNTRAEDQKTVANATNWYKNEISRLKNTGRFFDAGLVAERAVKSLKGLANIKEFENELQKIHAQPAYQKQLSEVVKTMQKEMGMQNSYISAMTEKDSVWWINQIRQLQDTTVANSDRLLNKRLLSYLGLVAYMFSDRAINEQNIETSGKYLEIYRMLEPVNAEHFFQEARRRMLMKDYETAISNLKLAAIFGFGDQKRILNDPLFEPIKNNPDFRELLR